MTNFTPRKIDLEKIKELQNYYASEIFGNPEQMEQVWQELHSFFSNKVPEIDFEYYDSFFRWYTDITWNLFRSQDENFVENTALSRQIFLAAMLNYRLPDKIITYLGTRGIDEDETKNLFVKFKEAFENSEAIIYQKEDEFYTLKDYFTEKEKLKQTSNDLALEKAKLYTKIRDNISLNPDVFDTYGYANVKDAFGMIDNTEAMFNQIAVDNVFEFVRSYTNPSLEDAYQEYLDRNLDLAQEENDIKQEDLESSETEGREDQKEIEETENTSQTSKQQEQSKKVDFSNIRQKVESQLGEIEELDPANITNFKKVLKAAAKQEGIEQDVEDWYYFDSQQGNFVWNEEKFNQN
jgi:hypothetical protein